MKLSPAGLARRKYTFRMPLPCSWMRLMRPGSVEGSSRKVVKAWGLACRAAWTGGRRWGREERLQSQYWSILARKDATAGQAPVRRWGRSPWLEVQVGRRQSPDSPVQCRQSQSVCYQPLNILACTVTALTAVGEKPQVPQSGWAPCPRGRKDGQRKCRLGRFEAAAVSFLCQCAVTAAQTLVFHPDLEDGGEVRVRRGSSSECILTEVLA